MSGSLILCVISLTYIIAINLCVLCVSVVRSTHSRIANFPIRVEDKQQDFSENLVYGLPHPT
ncbi:MAG: hypothetical protein O9295_25055 [Microcystis sp. LE18-22.4A]|uniref:hypothetical protein n=1 Tax=unclassified Microcystis TaxID=2643300 RepID=UPI002181E4C5|nr:MULTISPECIES: hypothetical protein [Microcystis]MCZ8121226.1 hypothetical protein [Microcystis sp. LE18-22.4A]